MQDGHPNEWKTNQARCSSIIYHSWSSAGWQGAGACPSWHPRVPSAQLTSSSQAWHTTTYGPSWSSSPQTWHSHQQDQKHTDTTQKTSHVVKELQGYRLGECRELKEREAEGEDSRLEGMEEFHFPGLLYLLCSLIKRAVHCGRQEVQRNPSDNSKKQQKTGCRWKEWHLCKHTDEQAHTNANTQP